MSSPFDALKCPLTVKRDYSNAKFNTYGLDWDSKGVRFWANLKSRFMGKFNFDQPFWERGNLASATVNGSVATNPWLSAENANAAPVRYAKDFDAKLSLTSPPCSLTRSSI